MIIVTCNFNLTFVEGREGRRKRNEGRREKGRDRGEQEGWGENGERRDGGRRE